MIAELVFGLRNMRAPLAAGYLWLFGLWLALAGRLDPADHPTGLVHEVDRLGQAAGKAGVIVAVTFVAYVVGVVSIAANPIIARIGNPIAATRLRAVMPRGQWGRVDAAIARLIWARIDERFLADEGTRSLAAQRLGRAQLSAAAANQPLRPEFTGDPVAVVESVRAEPERRLQLIRGLIDPTAHQRDCLVELLLAPLRIIGNDADLHAEYDRHRAEYELRTGLVLPLGYLAVVLAVTESPWWATGVAAAIVMLYLGVAANIEALTVLIESIGVRRIDLPALTNLATHALSWRDPDAVGARLAA